MQRHPSQLSRSEFDLVVVGGGIYGAWAALDAAQRGLRVALLERADFGGATSANHQRIIHGGLRYLQQANLRRFRQSVRERSTLLRIAPELVKPLPVVVPTTRGPGKHRLTMLTALAVNDLLSIDRNLGLADSHRIPRGRLVRPGEGAGMAEGFDFCPYTGAAVFYDAQLLSPERLIISIVKAAAEAGAVVANYVSAQRYVMSGGRARGVMARDELGGSEFEVPGRMVLNCAGPWSGEVVRALHEGATDARLGVLKAAVMLTRDIGLRAALAVPGGSGRQGSAAGFRKSSRNYFATPWRGLTLVGTFHAPHSGPAEDCEATAGELREWIAHLNAAWPGLHLSREDVLHVYSGLIPRASGSSGELEYARKYAIIDHEREHGVRGVISVCGVKFTTARAVAQEAVTMAVSRLKLPRASCRTGERLTISGPPLVENATEAAALLKGNAATLRATITRAVREEMACTLEDVVSRRTDLAAAGFPGDAALQRCGSIMGELLGWDLFRIEREVQRVRGKLSPGSCVHAA